MNYHNQEEKLFARWIDRAIQLNDVQQISKDGLLYRGEVYFDGYNQVHHPGDEEQFWDDAPLRALVLTKELYDEDCWDIRSETGRVPSPHLENYATAKRFFPNLEVWLYGLMNVPNRKVLRFDQADRVERRQQFYETAPIARINCRKQCGTKAASNALLQHSFENYADLLVEQINLYHADILLCSGGQGIIVDFLKKHLYTDLQSVNRHCYFSPLANVLVVRSYYPSYYVYGRKEMYTNLIRDYQSFLDAHPQFPHKR